MKSSQQFLNSEPGDLVELSKQGVRYDYDVIEIEDVRFVDSKPDRTNETVRKISDAVRRSKLATSKSNFWLKVRDNGSFHLEQLV